MREIDAIDGRWDNRCYVKVKVSIQFHFQFHQSDVGFRICELRTQPRRLGSTFPRRVVDNMYTHRIGLQRLQVKSPNLGVILRFQIISRGFKIDQFSTGFPALYWYSYYTYIAIRYCAFMNSDRLVQDLNNQSWPDNLSNLCCF